MDALEKARELVSDAYYDERGMAEIMRRDAAIWAAIAQAEQLKRIADRLEAISELRGGFGHLNTLAVEQ